MAALAAPAAGAKRAGAGTFARSCQGRRSKLAVFTSTAARARKHAHPRGIIALRAAIPILGAETRCAPRAKQKGLQPTLEAFRLLTNPAIFRRGLLFWED
jgi:hypothetical protein